MPPTDCPSCTSRAFNHPAYSYLLGLYLGDGHIVSKPKQHHLSIFCADAWPGLIDEAETAMRKVMPLPSVQRRQKNGCAEVKSYTKHWTCMFPQHGPGKKHGRVARGSDPFNISVARRASVALMDKHVGPKY